ncbi:colicin transporter [Pseudophaeobacter sp.]|uniref:colicin transporter n=1 Tax=Pseudophaeobacter sp. TaxID=1971739 RepID=UPI00329955F0
MTQIEELQGRILTAMERIGAGVGKLEQARAVALEEAEAAADTSVLEQALDEEKTANAQLEERVKVLHARMKELEQAAPAASGDAAAEGDMAALQAELELLRNEVGNTDEKDALKLEVTRLKAALENASNGLAAEKEALEDQVSELTEQNQQLQSQLEETASTAEGDVEGDIGAAVDQAALEAEVAALKTALEAAQASSADSTPASTEATENEILVRLDTELQQLRLANEQLRSSNAALRDANAEGLADADLINAALQAEIEALRAAQASDQAQVNAVLAKLEPLLANAQSLPEHNLPEGEEV